MSTPAGLHVVATPLGHRGDLSPRAREVLLAADLILAEDTRRLRTLLGGDVDLPSSLSCHEHNEHGRVVQAVEAVRNGQTVALVTDQGTPAISDPGFRIVRACRADGLPVWPVPGPAAVTTALSVSGLPTDMFLFLGFLPPKPGRCRNLLAAHADDPWTLVAYESPHRIVRTLEAIAEVAGPERVVAVMREMTKQHETYTVGPVGEIRAAVADAPVKGEFTLLIAKAGYTLSPDA